MQQMSRTEYAGNEEYKICKNCGEHNMRKMLKTGNAGNMEKRCALCTDAGNMEKGCALCTDAGNMEK